MTEEPNTSAPVPGPVASALENATGAALSAMPGILANVITHYSAAAGEVFSLFSPALTAGIAALEARLTALESKIGM